MYMKYLIFPLLATFGYCFINNSIENSIEKSSTFTLPNKMESNKMKIKIGSSIFMATLDNTKTTAALKAMLPLRLNMSELNGNEKYFHFDTDLPTNAKNPQTILEGDLMLWGSNSLVLFYKTFPTTYSYTKLGHIDNPQGLAKAVGLGRASVTFEIE